MPMMSLKMPFEKTLPMFYSFKLCRHYLHNGSRKKRFRACIRLTCRPSTLKIRNTSTSANATSKDELERSITGKTRVLVDVSCSPCGLSNILACHSSRHSRVLSVQALQRSFKKNKRSRVYHRQIQNFSTYRSETMPILEIITLCRRWRRRDTTEASRSPPRNTTFLQLFACLAQRLSAFTSRCRTDKAGRGALEPPP